MVAEVVQLLVDFGLVVEEVDLVEPSLLVGEPVVLVVVEKVDFFHQQDLPKVKVVL
jgi:hypothetical protein